MSEENTYGRINIPTADGYVAGFAGLRGTGTGTLGEDGDSVAQAAMLFEHHCLGNLGYLLQNDELPPDATPVIQSTATTSNIATSLTHATTSMTATALATSHTLPENIVPTFLGIPAEVRSTVYKNVFQGSVQLWSQHKATDELTIEASNHYKTLLACKLCFKEGYSLYIANTHIICDGPYGAEGFFNKVQRGVTNLCNLRSIEGVFPLDTVSMHAVESCKSLKKIDLLWGKERIYQSLDDFKTKITDEQLMSIIRKDPMFDNVSRLMLNLNKKAQISMKVDFILGQTGGILGERKNFAVPCRVNVRTGEISKAFDKEYDFGKMMLSDALRVFEPWSSPAEEMGSASA